MEVTLERIDDLKVIFDSRDMDVHGEFDTIEPLQMTGDPFDPFALQKACLLACGIIPREGHELSEIYYFYAGAGAEDQSDTCGDSGGDEAGTG